MKRADGIISTILLAVFLLCAVALLVFNLVRLPGAVLNAAPATLISGPAPKLDRPLDVGNATGDSFALKLERPVIVPASGLIRIKDETFSAAYDELYNHRDLYYGREIELSGYVLTQNDLEAGDFLVGRDLLWCCENDKYFIGFLANSTGTVPEPGTTVLIRGVLEAREYHDEDKQKTFMVPAIRVTRCDILPGVPKTVYQACSVP